MLKTIEGIIREGKVELLEPVPEGVKGRVIVTFLDDRNLIYLPERGISREEAAELRHRLSAFAEDWEAPEMDVYDAI